MHCTEIVAAAIIACGKYRRARTTAHVNRSITSLTLCLLCPALPCPALRTNPFLYSPCLLCPAPPCNALHYAALKSPAQWPFEAHDCSERGAGSGRAARVPAPLMTGPDPTSSRGADRLADLHPAVAGRGHGRWCRAGQRMQNLELLSARD